VRARVACIELHAGRIEEAPVGTRLLGSIRTVLNGEARIATGDLLDLLVKLEDEPWGDWGGKPITPRKLSSLLRPYEVKPRREGPWRGYFRADFEDVWERYLEPVGADWADRADTRVEE
jgi:hypothetical protein